MSRRAKRRQHPPQQILREQRQAAQQPPVRGALALAEPQRSSLNALNADDLKGGASQQWQNWSLNAAGKPIPEMESEPRKLPDTDIFGASGTAIFSGIITSDEYNPDLLSPIDRSQVYDQMRRNHAPVAAMLRLLSLPILRADAKIEAGEDGDDEVASFVDTCLFHDMCYETTEGAVYRQTWDEILRHILLMYGFGFMGFELGYRVDDGWTKWSKWTPLLPRTIWRWWVGSDNELAGIQQWTFRHWSYEFVNIPAWKTLIFTYNQEGANYEGISILRAAYKHWMYVQGFEKIDAIALERSAVVPPVIALPENYTGADLQAAQTIVQNIRANEFLGVTIPNTWGFEYPRNQAKYAAQTQPAIQYGNTMILTAALADWVALGQGPGATGTYALADIKVKMFQEALQGDVQLIEQRVNTAIRRLVDYNFEDVEVYPTLKFGKIALSDVAGMAQAIQQLVQVQALHPTPELEEAILDGLGLPKGQGVASAITSTNPTSPTTPPQPQNPQTAGQNEESDLTQPNAGAQVVAGGGQGAALSEHGLSEGQLLTETLAAIRGVDVVERGMVFYNPNHDPHSGRFAPGGAGGAAEGGSAEGGKGGGRSGGGKSGGSRASRGGGTRASKGAQDRADANSARPGQPRGSGKAARGAKADEAIAAGKGGARAAKAKASAAPQPAAAEGMHERAPASHEERVTRAQEGVRTAQERYDRAVAAIRDVPQPNPGEILPPGQTHRNIVELNKADRALKSAKTRLANLQKAEPAKAESATAEGIHERAAQGKASSTSTRAKASTSRTSTSSSGKAEGGAATAAAGKGETIHETAARMQREQGLAREVTPQEAGPLGEHLTVHDYNARPAARPGTDAGGKSRDALTSTEHPDARFLAQFYGEHQLGAALARFDKTRLNKTARELGLTPGKTKEETVSRITAHVTEGRYSANFGQGEAKAGAKGKAEGSTSTRAKGSAAKGGGERTLEQHTHAELKAMAKDRGIAAGKTKEETIRRLRMPQAPKSSPLAHPEEHAAYHAAMAKVDPNVGMRQHHEFMARYYQTQAETLHTESTARAERFQKVMANPKQREMIHQAYRDVASGRAYLDRQGKNYHLYTTDEEGYVNGRTRASAPWNKVIQATHTHDEFFQRSREYAQQHPDEIKRVKRPIGGFSERNDVQDFIALMEGGKA